MKNNKTLGKAPLMADFLRNWRNYTQTSYEQIYLHSHLRKSSFTQVKKLGFHSSLTLQHVANMANYLRSLLDSKEEVDQLARDLGYALMEFEGHKAEPPTEEK